MQERFFAPVIASGWDHNRRHEAGPVDSSKDTWLLSYLIDGTYLDPGYGRHGPGSMLLLPPGRGRHWRRVGRSREVAVRFRLEPGRPEDAHEAWGQSVPEALPAECRTMIERGITAISGLWWWESRARMRANGLLGILISDVLQSLQPSQGDHCRIPAPPPPEGPVDPALDTTLSEVERLAASRLNNWRTTDMARAAGMSRQAFSKAFHRARNETPGAFLDRLRLSYTEGSLLAPGEPDLNFIAHSVGFVNVSALGRWFRRHRGTSLLAWRAHMRGQG